MRTIFRLSSISLAIFIVSQQPSASFIVPSNANHLTTSATFISASKLTNAPTVSKESVTAHKSRDQPVAWWQHIFGQFFGKVAENENSSEPSRQTTQLPTKAVIVFGATGKTGQQLVRSLLSVGKEVVVVGRNVTKLSDLYGKNPSSNLFLHHEPIDVTNPADVAKLPQLFQGVSQLALCLGPTFQDVRTSTFSSEQIDYIAVKAIVEQFKVVQANREENNDEDVVQTIANFDQQNRQLSAWRRLDDVIMGGRSISRWEEINWNGEGSSFCRWSGELIKDGGGFCGTRMDNLALPIATFDGIKIKFRGDGSRLKFGIRSGDQQYQAMFDTIAGTWQEVHLPFAAFTAVQQSKAVYRAPNLSTREKIDSVGLIYSKFTYNGRFNRFSNRSRFAIDVASIDLYRAPRPEVVLVSAAGTERINKLVSIEETKRDIPIIQLNPKGILNWKYRGEEAVRTSGLRYTIIQAAGLATPNATDVLLNQKRRMEFAQGNVLTGRILREEVAEVVLAALNSPYAVDKTFEVRRDESNSGRLVTEDHANNFGLIDGELDQTTQNFDREFRALVRDDDRAISAALDGDILTAWTHLPPLPFANDPLSPAPPAAGGPSQ